MVVGDGLKLDSVVKTHRQTNKGKRIKSKIAINAKQHLFLGEKLGKLAKPLKTLLYKISGKNIKHTQTLRSIVNI